MNSKQKIKVKENKPTLIQTEYGYYQYRPLPSDEELEDFYANHYFQQGLGSYSVQYEKEEIDYFKLKAWMIHDKTTELSNNNFTSLLDVGCGEGWLMDCFHQSGCQVTGFDYSKAGISKFHPHLMPNLHQGNVFKLLDEAIQNKKVYDIISLCNVIEHVKFPEKLMSDLQKIMHDDSILIVIAPNDFSKLQLHLFDNQYISKKWWLSYPSHLSYFNQDNFRTMLNGLKYNVNCIVAENPVDLNVLNDNSNYIEDSSKGRAIHFYRVRQDNFLAGIDRKKLLQIYEIYGSMGVGRDLVYYCTIQRNKDES